MKTILAAAAIAAAATLVAPQAHAGSYTIYASEGVTNGQGFDTTNQNEFNMQGPNVSQAIFTYTGSLNFDNEAGQNPPGGGDTNSNFGFTTSNISNYNGAGTVTFNNAQVANSSNVNTFLASSGSASGFSYGSWYAIDLGTLTKGTVLDITHDDGVSVYQGGFESGTREGNTVSGQTVKTEDFVTLTGTSDTWLYYSRQNGTPSILEVAIPEPMTISLLGAGVASLAFLRRRRSPQAQA